MKLCAVALWIGNELDDEARQSSLEVSELSSVPPAELSENVLRSFAGARRRFGVVVMGQGTGRKPCSHRQNPMQMQEGMR